MRLYILYTLCLLVLSKNEIQAQQKTGRYQQNSIFYDTHCFYTYGIKWINDSNGNREADGYEHDYDFYISKFDPNGKKQWEHVFDKKRTFVISTTELFKHDIFIYTLIAFRSFNPDRGISYINHYLVRLDSLGNVAQEYKLKDSTFYVYSSVFYTKDFIWIALNKDKEGIVCEKYDYNFKLLETITNPVLTHFFYDSQFTRTNKHYISVGPVQNMDDMNQQIRNKTRTIFYQPTSYEIKKTVTGITNHSKITVTALPVGENIYNMCFNNSNLYINTRNRKQKRNIFVYNEEMDKLTLLTDTFTCGFICFKVLSENEFLFVSQRKVARDGNNKTIYPEILYYIKNGKVITRHQFKELYNEYAKNEFRVIGKNLFVYQVNHDGENIKVSVYDYEKGILLE